MAFVLELAHAEVIGAIGAWLRQEFGLGLGLG